MSAGAKIRMTLEEVGFLVGCRLAWSAESFGENVRRVVDSAARTQLKLCGTNVRFEEEISGADMSQLVDDPVVGLGRLRQSYLRVGPNFHRGVEELLRAVTAILIARFIITENFKS